MRCKIKDFHLPSFIRKKMGLGTRSTGTSERLFSKHSARYDPSLSKSNGNESSWSQPPSWKETSSLRTFTAGKKQGYCSVIGAVSPPLDFLCHTVTGVCNKKIFHLHAESRTWFLIVLPKQTFLFIERSHKTLPHDTRPQCYESLHLQTFCTDPCPSSRR